jgi:putative endonuclease
MYYVYILLCTGNTLYTGISNHPKQRFQDHLHGKGGHYTKAHPPIKLLYTEPVGTRSQALKREHQIKSWPRIKKIKNLNLNANLLLPKP